MKHYQCTRCGAIIETNNHAIPTMCTAPAPFSTSGICGNGSFVELIINIIPETVAIIVNAWIDYQDHDHDLPGYMGPERIEHFSRKMAEPEQNQTKITQVIDDMFGPFQVTECCKIGPITNENYCPNCGKKVIK